MAPKKKVRLVEAEDLADIADIDETINSGSGSSGAAIKAPPDADVVGSKAGSNEAGSKAGTSGASGDPQSMEEIEEVIKAADGSRVIRSVSSEVLGGVGKSDSPPGGLSSFKIASPVASPAKTAVTKQALEFFDENKSKFEKLYINNIYEVVLPKGGKTITKNVLKQILTDDAVAREVEEDIAEEAKEEEEEEEEEEGEWDSRDQLYDYTDHRGKIKNYLMLPNVGSLESQMTNEKEALKKLKEEYATSQYMPTLTTMQEEIKKRKYTKSESDGFNCAVEMIEKLETGDTAFRDTFLKAFMPGFKHFGVLPHAIDQTETKMRRIAEATVVVTVREAEKKAAKAKVASEKKAKRDLANALGSGSSSAVESSRVAKKSRDGSASDSALRMLMLQ